MDIPALSAASWIPLSALAVLVLAERMAAARAMAPGVALVRLVRHGALGLAGSVLAGLIAPAGLAGAAMWAASADAGLLNRIEGLAPLAAVLIGWLLLDAAIWAQHVAMHRIPLLWRLHRVHHGDTAMDASTALRFHPGEIVASLGWKMAAVVLLGAPVEAALLFQAGLTVAALFNHANIALPAPLDRALAWVLVTPRTHLIHHHPDPAFTDTNFGNVLTLWDRLAGLHRDAAPVDEQGAARIGLDAFRTPAEQTLSALLVQPAIRAHNRD